MPYQIKYSSNAEKHLQALTARQRAIVFDIVDEQLLHQPIVETRNRKRMRSNLLASWELRIGTLRVYYEVEDEPEIVVVRAVGVKKRNDVFIGNEVLKLEEIEES